MDKTGLWVSARELLFDDFIKSMSAENRKRQTEWWLGEIARQLALAALALLLYFMPILVYSWQIAMRSGDAQWELTFFRTVQIENGVTPLLPLSFIGVILVLWSSWHRKRLERLTKDTPFGIAMHEHKLIDELKGVSKAERKRPVDAYATIGFLAQPAIRIREKSFYILAWGRGLGHLLWVVFSVIWLWLSFENSYESLLLPTWLGLSTYDIVFRTGVVVALLALSSTLYRFLSVGQDLRHLLKTLASTPLLTAFERLPKRISRLARLPLFAQPGSWVARSISEQNRQYLDRIAARLDAWPEEGENMILLCDRRSEEERTDAIRKCMKTVPERRIESPREKERRDSDFVDHCRVADFLTEVEDVLKKAWTAEPGMSEARIVAEDIKKPSSEPPDISSVASQVQRRFLATPVGLWLRTAEEFVAVEIVGYVESILKQLQRMLIFLLPAMLATGMLIGSYPFEPQGLISTLFIAIICASVGVFIYVMISLNRDEILSRLSHTDPHRLTWHSTFVFNLFLILAVGLIALVSTEYPTVWHFFLGWFRPLLEAVAG